MERARGCGVIKTSTKAIYFGNLAIVINWMMERCPLPRKSANLARIAEKGAWTHPILELQEREGSIPSQFQSRSLEELDELSFLHMCGAGYDIPFHAKMRPPRARTCYLDPSGNSRIPTSSNYALSFEILNTATNRVFYNSNISIQSAVGFSFNPSNCEEYVTTGTWVMKMVFAVSDFSLGRTLQRLMEPLRLLKLTSTEALLV